MSEVEWMDIFGDNLRDILDEQKMSQRELSRVTGISNTTINRYINKQIIPSATVIVALSYALDCDVDELVDFRDNVRF